jgi:hypothetical protein
MNYGFDQTTFQAVCDTVSTAQQTGGGDTQFPGGDENGGEEGGLLEGLSAIAIGGAGILVLLIIVLFLI